MATWLERTAGPGGLPLALVYLELILALTFLTTGLHFRALRKTRDELTAVRMYFLAFFVLLLAIPCSLVFLTSSGPWAALASFGWTFGRAGLGFALAGAGLPLAVLAGFVGSRDPEMQKMYPFAKAACGSIRTFVGYELSYLFLYYLPWEFVFRGVLFLPLVPAVGLIPALTIQTVISTLLHIGHPDTEIFAAAGAGLVFGLIAWATGSFLYPLVLHAATGIATDTFLFLRRGQRTP
ncbi:MAG: CPBP family intramembrane metalloprotease [Acidobacteria bacterium]|nr:CPBP family intramembrane metalloprotease [Acidobacteriota bacterium]MBE3126315.1 CPBP family intramembrane metalloprotease [Acidobacteriota bacterium]